MPWMTEAGERALEEAASAIEAVSSVEVVIAIRPRARDSFTAHAFVGLVAAVGLFAFLVQGPVRLARWQIIVCPILAAIAGMLLVEGIPALYRWLLPSVVRYVHVREAANSTFLEKGVHATRERTGLLVYIAQRERMVQLVGDLAVVKHHGIEELAAWAGTLEARLPRGAEAFARELAALAPRLATSLPRRHDDTNELADKPVIVAAKT